MSSSEAGLIITTAVSLSRFQYWIRQSTEMENQMTSIDRIMEYGKLPPETSEGYLLLSFLTKYSINYGYDGSGSKPIPNWPSLGEIIFDDITIRYSPTDPPVLKNISCAIKPKEKVFFKLMCHYHIII